MKLGTRSLLFGAHCFFIHPWFVAWAWWKLYWFPLDPRLWVAFVIHDWGYWGCANMDDERGERHPIWAAMFVKRWFPGWPPGPRKYGEPYGNMAWYSFMLDHSRFLARNRGSQPSMLCWADKLAFTLQPWWLYLPLAWLTGELADYLSDAAPRYGMGHSLTARQWHRAASAKMARVAYDGAARYWKSVDESLSPADQHVDTLKDANWVRGSWLDIPSLPGVVTVAAPRGVIRCVCGEQYALGWLPRPCPKCGHDWRPADRVV